jgi:hypothetical protein
MPPLPTVFAQITSRIFPVEFARCASDYPMPRSCRSFSAYDHFLALCFGHLTGRESLRDVITCLAARPGLQYRLGFRGRITRTNFAYANQHRDWRVFATVAQLLMRKAARLYGIDPVRDGMPELVYALGASIIHLSLKLFPWAFYPRSNEILQILSVSAFEETPINQLSAASAGKSEAAVNKNPQYLPGILTGH